MMTTVEILKEIHKLPKIKQNELKKTLLQDKEISQEEFDQMLLEEGFLANLPTDFEEDNFAPVKFTGKPISETIIEERR